MNHEDVLNYNIRQTKEKKWVDVQRAERERIGCACNEFSVEPREQKYGTEEDEGVVS
jgi:hypothetical protein